MAHPLPPALAVIRGPPRSFSQFGIFFGVLNSASIFDHMFNGKLSQNGSQKLFREHPFRIQKSILFRRGSFWGLPGSFWTRLVAFWSPVGSFWEHFWSMLGISSIKNHPFWNPNPQSTCRKSQAPPTKELFLGMHASPTWPRAETCLW